MNVIAILSLTGSLIGLYESKSPKSPPLITEKAIDISELCPGVKEQAIIKYSRCSNGEILIQLKDCTKKDKDIGPTIHYLCSKEDEACLSQDPSFIRFVEDHWCADPSKVAKAIFDNIPENPDEQIVM